MNKNINIAKLIEECKKHDMPQEQIDKIEKAAIFAQNKHEGQFRKSGEPYIIHPIQTALILLSWKMDYKTIITGLLHDVLEDTETTNEEIIENFGEDIFKLVNYVTKVNMFSKENRGNQSKNENEYNYIIQVLMSMSHDLRAMIVKLADRFHNIQTINFLREDKQRRIALETIKIYAMVAGRLGMYRLKTNLLDMCFKILNPVEYEQTKNKIDSILKNNMQTWTDITNQIKGILDSYSIEYKIKTRTKGVYSTWEKIQKGYNIRDIHDIYAIRIIAKDNLDCYKILGLIHLNYIFINKAFKDYISLPKFNFYQSIHTTIVKNQALIEIQIRTEKMDVLAENGIAAHWNYKENTNPKNIVPATNLIEEISNISEKNLSEITNITNDIVFVVTLLNDGKTYNVNNKTKCIDLAYRFDNEKFKYLESVVINGKVSNFDILLQPHDVIKFNYSTQIQIKKHWLKYTNFHRTINGIKEILKNESDEIIMNEEQFLSYIKSKLGNNFIGYDETLKRIKKWINVDSIAEMLNVIPNTTYNDKDFFKLFDKRKQIRRKAFSKLIEKSSIELRTKKEFYFDKIEGLYFSDLQFPKCCNKVPGMKVMGSVSRDGILEVHNHSCKNGNRARGKYKIYPLNWNEEALITKPRKFRFELSFSAYWSPSIGNTITTKFKKFNNLINEIIVKKNKNSLICDVHVVVYTSHINQIKATVAELNQEINIKSHFDF